MNSYFSDISILQLTIALNIDSRLSPHIVSGVLSAMPPSGFTYNEVKEILSEQFPSIPIPSIEDWDSAKRVLDEHAKNHIHSISILDDKYPQFLRSIKNAPPAIYLRGDMKILNELPGVAIVGTRKVTKHGSEIAKRISTFMAKNGWVVVSGLAIGVDAAAHNGALLAEGKTIAVLAHGLHKASPKQNSVLADEIILNGGAWMSEYIWGQEPRREFFVQRNRIQSGLSSGSIIIESEIKSGTATQALFCIDANRKLFAVVPSSPENPLGLLSEGPLNLVREKNATPISSRDDYPMVLQSLLERKTELLHMGKEYIHAKLF